MEPFVHLDAIAAPIDMDNVDNDQVLPSRFMRKPRADGQYGTYFFHDLRFDEAGRERDFVLQKPAYRSARIIVGARNYACGSSRLGAVYVHYDFGIRSIVAASFGDVFFNNCFKNGILPIRLPDEQVRELRRQLHAMPGAHLAVDLPSQTVAAPDGTQYGFTIDAFSKRCLLEGLSDIELTFGYLPQILDFEAQRRNAMPWLIDSGSRP